MKISCFALPSSPLDSSHRKVGPQNTTETRGENLMRNIPRITSTAFIQTLKMGEFITKTKLFSKNINTLPTSPMACKGYKMKQKNTSKFYVESKFKLICVCLSYLSLFMTSIQRSGLILITINFPLSVRRIFWGIPEAWEVIC